MRIEVWISSSCKLLMNAIIRMIRLTMSINYRQKLRRILSSCCLETRQYSLPNNYERDNYLLSYRPIMISCTYQRTALYVSNFLCPLKRQGGVVVVVVYNCLLYYQPRMIFCSSIEQHCICLSFFCSCCLFVCWPVFMLLVPI